MPVYNFFKWVDLPISSCQYSIVLPNFLNNSNPHSFNNSINFSNFGTNRCLQSLYLHIFSFINSISSCVILYGNGIKHRSNAENSAGCGNFNHFRYGTHTFRIRNTGQMERLCPCYRHPPTFKPSGNHSGY